MSDNRAMKYAEILSKLVKVETISSRNNKDKTKFLEFHKTLEELLVEKKDENIPVFPKPLFTFAPNINNLIIYENMQLSFTTENAHEAPAIVVPERQRDSLIAKGGEELCNNRFTIFKKYCLINLYAHE
mgnify:CR=1 FL=1